MDFLDPKKRRNHRIRLTVGYFLVAIVVLEISYLVFLMSTGLGIDRQTGRVIQNGLVYVSSHPVSADVYINGRLEGNTSLKLTIPEGNYNFTIKSPGYRNWSSVINLAGGSVEQLTYPLLIPQKLTQKDIKVYNKAPSLSSASPDRHWLVVLKPGSLTDFDVFDLTKPALPPIALKIPTLLNTSSSGHLLKVVEWADDNKHLLVEHSFKAGKEFIVLDRTTSANAYNLNALLNVSPDKVTLRNKKYDQMYLYFAKTKSLLTANTANQQINTILNNVIDFVPNGGNIIIYSSNQSKVVGQYSVNMWDGQKSYLLHNYPATSYLLDMAEYNNQIYVAVAPVSSGRVYIFKNPLVTMKTGKVPTPFIALKMVNPRVLEFSANYRFISAQSGSAFAVYDFDTDLWHYFSLKDKVALTSKAKWMDNNRFIINIDGIVNIFDFNGANRQKLVPSNAGSNSYFDRNYSHIYTLSPSALTPTRQALTGTSLILGK